MKLSEGKYEFRMQDGLLICLRHGKPWRDFAGDNAVLALFDYAEWLETVASDREDLVKELRAEMQKLSAKIAQLKDEIDDLTLGVKQ